MSLSCPYCTVLYIADDDIPELNIQKRTLSTSCILSILLISKTMLLCHSHAHIVLCYILQIMRETLIYLSHLDHEDTEQQVMFCCAMVRGLLYVHHSS